MSERYLILVSDCHLSAGRFFEGHLSPHEEFHSDAEFVDFLEFFSSGKYGDSPSGAVEVELFINGDFLDFLNVPYHGEFEDSISEEVSLYKLEAILGGHPQVFEAIRKFAGKSGKKVTYLIGNHDADLFFPKVRERLIQAWDPQRSTQSEKVKIIVERDNVSFEGGLEIRHGNQFEAGNELDLNEPFFESPFGQILLKLPWGSIYVLKIVNRMRWERNYLGKVHPTKIFLLYGLIFDTWFTLRFFFLTSLYFLKTKVFRKTSDGSRANWQKKMEIIRQETKTFQTLEEYAREILDQKPEVNTVVFGHTHRPMNRVFPDGKQYINSGTWTKMVDLDLRNFGRQSSKTFVLVQFKNGKADSRLCEWVGEHGPHRIFTT